MGGRGWERREVAALAPRRDEKPSKPGEEEKHWQGRSQTPEAIRKREEDLPNFFFSPAADCVCGQTADLVWKL